MAERASTIELESRIDEAESLLCAGLSSGTVSRELAKKYSVTPRQARDYITGAYRRWEKQAAKDAPYRREKVVRMVERLFAKAMAAENYGAASSAASLLMKMSIAPATQSSQSRSALLRKLGRIPKDPSGVLLWAQRAMVLKLVDVLRNPALDEERRLRWVTEIGSKLGLMSPRSITEAKLLELEGRLAAEMARNAAADDGGENRSH